MWVSRCLGIESSQATLNRPFLLLNTNVLRKMYFNIVRPPFGDEEVPVILWSLVISGLQSAHAEAAEQIYVRGGGLAWEAEKQPIIRAKHPRLKVKSWGGLKPPSITLVHMQAQFWSNCTMGRPANKQLHLILIPSNFIIRSFEALSALV